ncbi:MAG TPA: DUF1302 family protein [Solimonas sp.]|nr:DUF1302 family protein [Solimonas sp.]
MFEKRLTESGHASLAMVGHGLTGSRSLHRFLAVAVLLGISAPAMAAKFFFDFADDSVEVLTNTTLIAGVSVRTEAQNERMIAKGHLNPDVCGRTPDGKLWYQTCQGLFREQSFPAAQLANAPGYASSNFDQGNLNYERGDITQSGFRLNQDMTLSWGDFGVFIRGFAFWDPVNNDFTEYNPNYITSENVSQVGYTSFPGDEIIRLGGIQNALGILGPVVSQLGLDDNIVGQLLANPTAIPVLGVRNDSEPCPASRNPDNRPCGIVYGPGGKVYTKRTEKETLRKIGLGAVLQEFNLYGTVETPWEEELMFKVGRQQVQWGEATIEFFDSLNVANPPSLQNLFRLGGNGLDDFYQPLNMISLSTNLFEGATISGFYQLEWQPVEAPAAGSFYSPFNADTNNGGPDYLTIAFGQLAHDPEGIANLLDSPLTGITNTTSRLERLKDREPDWQGQFGIQFKYYADWLNDGTDIGLYFANYHSRIPMASIYSSDMSCGKNATDLATYVLACPDIPLLNGIYTPNQPDRATDDSVAFDSLKAVLEYPEDIQMYGLSFNTTIGTTAIQGEVAYRPKQPFQVALVDLAFAGLGPTLTNCHLPPGCLGSNVGLGTMPDGSVGAYGSSDYVVDANGTPGAFADTFDAIIGHLPGSGRSFPNFVVPYRGGTIGLNPANSYIRGWEEFQSYSFNLGATLVQGTSELMPSLIGADQIIWLIELGGFWVPDLPALDELQLESPGIEWHASAGADGSGADRSRQACSTNAACSYGPDGLRFNPHQQDLDLFPDELSMGYSIVALIRYESVLPGISIQPQIIFKHDFYNTSPGLVSNYVDGRIIWDTGVEVRYKSNLSLNLGYQMFAGGGVANLLNDRDNARVFLKYAF